MFIICLNGYFLKGITNYYLFSTIIKVILKNKNFKDIGVGRSGNYWTQVFGAK